MDKVLLDSIAVVLKEERQNIHALMESKVAAVSEAEQVARREALDAVVARFDATLAVV